MTPSICNDAGKFNATFGLECDQDIGTGGFADSNGDDNMALLLNGDIVDMFGIPGEDGSGTGHEFEDGRAERAADNTSASATWDEAGWNIDNDSGGGDGPVYAPEGFDPSAWIGAGEVSDDVYGCMDMFALNYNLVLQSLVRNPWLMEDLLLGKEGFLVRWGLLYYLLLFVSMVYYYH